MKKSYKILFTAFITVVMTALSCKAASGFSSLEDFAGRYNWDYFGLNGSYGEQHDQLIIEITDAATGEVSISGFPLAQKFTVSATVDIEAGIVTITNKQYLGLDSDLDPTYFYFKRLGYDGAVIDGAVEESAVTADIEGTSIVWAEDIVWAIGDPAHEKNGWWICSRNNVLTHVLKVDACNGWKEYCNGTFVDGWLLRAVGFDPEAKAWTVAVEQNEEIPYLFKIVDPYRNQYSPLKDTSKEAGCIIFSVKDPDYVEVLPEVYSGFNSGSNKVNCLNVEGYYGMLNYTHDFVIKTFEITPSSVENGNVVHFRNCRVNWAGILNTLNVTKGDMIGRLVLEKPLIGGDDPLPGAVTTVEADTDAAPEYFNLQGVRVNNPSDGIYIVRRGHSVSKEYIK